MKLEDVQELTALLPQDRPPAQFRVVDTELTALAWKILEAAKRGDKGDAERLALIAERDKLLRAKGCVWLDRPGELGVAHVTENVTINPAPAEDVTKKRGRPATGAMTAAERKAKQRAKG